MSGQVLGIVPARLASTRLPNKPLYPLLGKPLIEWVWRRVHAMQILDHAVVATDSAEVADVCRSLGAPVELTSYTRTVRLPGEVIEAPGRSCRKLAAPVSGRIVHLYAAPGETVLVTEVFEFITASRAE